MLESYVTEDEGEKKIVILAKMDTSTQPPHNNLISWKNTQSLNPETGFELNNWENFRENQKQEYNQLMKDFYDPKCVELLDDFNVVAVMPSVWSMSGSSPFHPAFLVYVKIIEGCELYLKEYLTLSDDRVLKLVFEENYFFPGMMNGISANGFDNDYGSIGGICEDGKGNMHLITCEHVIHKALEKNKGLGVLGSSS